MRGGSVLARARGRAVSTVFVDAFLCAIGVLLILILTFKLFTVDPPLPQYDLRLTCAGVAPYAVAVRQDEETSPRVLRGLDYNQEGPLRDLLTEAARSWPRAHLRLMIDASTETAACADRIARLTKGVADALAVSPEGGAVLIVERRLRQEAPDAP